MRSIEREVKRNRKIARSQIRLKHSLAADDEIEDYLEQEKEALAAGLVQRIAIDIKDLLDS